MFSQSQLNQLYRYALSLSADEQTAYDLVQSSIERYLKKTGACSAVLENPSAYLRSIIRNAYFDLLRHHKVVPMVSMENEKESCSVVGLVSDDEMQDILVNQQEVAKLLEGLNSQENELLYLWAVEERTVDEISKIYDKPKGTMLSRLHRLKKRIRQQFSYIDGSVEKRKSERL